MGLWRAARRIGLKPQPASGGRNLCLLPAGTKVLIDPTWAKVTVQDGPFTGEVGWVKRADLDPLTGKVASLPLLL